MAYNFRRGDLDQLLLLPPDPRDWLPAAIWPGSCAMWSTSSTSARSCAPTAPTGTAIPRTTPSCWRAAVRLRLGVRSSRQIQRRCTEDLAFRVLAGNQFPDHVTIARFRVRHQQALAGFLVVSLKLCAAAGLVRLGVVALDGTKVAANAATTASHTQEKLQEKIEAEVAEILRQAAQADQREDREHGQPVGTSSRRRWPPRPAGWRGCGRPRPSWRPRPPRGNAGMRAGRRAGGRAKGKQPRAHIKPRRRDEAPNPKATANTTDPDSRFMHTRRGSVQGYNAQAVTTCEQVIVAAELTQQANDLQQLDPMLAATAATLGAAGIPERLGRLLADCGYWTIANLTQLRTRRSC